MSGEARRRLRVLYTAGLLVSLPLAGYLWSISEEGATLWGAAGATALSVLLLFAAEYLTASTEAELAHMKSAIAVERALRTDTVSQLEERVRQQDRILEGLSSQYHDLKARLVSPPPAITGERSRDLPSVEPASRVS